MWLFHITPREAWERAMRLGSYQPASLESEGFIHLSTADQWRTTACRLFAGQPDLVLLCLRAEALSDVRFERGEDVDESFPHLYGPLDPAQVERAVPLLWANGEVDGASPVPGERGTTPSTTKGS